MFFKNASIALFAKFVWFGLIFGMVAILVDIIIRISRKNVYVYNLVTFAYVLVFGAVYSYLTLVFFNYSFCWFGLFGMILGAILVKISIEFLFDKLIRLLYNKIVISRRNRQNGKLQSYKKG